MAYLSPLLLLFWARTTSCISAKATSVEPETWKTIPFAPNYEISSRKRVRNKSNSRIMRVSSTNHVYIGGRRPHRNVKEIYDMTFLPGMVDE